MIIKIIIIKVNNFIIYYYFLLGNNIKLSNQNRCSLVDNTSKFMEK